MKQLLFILIILSVTACSKNPAKPSNAYPSQGNVLVMVMSDDTLEYAAEYQTLEPFDSLELFFHSQFYAPDSHYDCYVSIPGAALIEFDIYYPCECVDTFPMLWQNPSWNVSGGTTIEPDKFVHVNHEMHLDSIDMKFLTPFADNSGWESAWEAINDLNIINQYRVLGSNSKVGYIALQNENGAEKKYFFLVKTIQ